MHILSKEELSMVSGGRPTLSESMTVAGAIGGGAGASTVIAGAGGWGGVSSLGGTAAITAGGAAGAGVAGAAAAGWTIGSMLYENLPDSAQSKVQQAVGRTVDAAPHATAIAFSGASGIGLRIIEAIADIFSSDADKNKTKPHHGD
jgi:hypothetical protein